MIKSTAKGSEGKLTTYAFYPLGFRIHFTFSEVKWHMGNKYKRAPVWFAYVDGHPSFFIWKMAIFFDGRDKRKR